MSTTFLDDRAERRAEQAAASDAQLCPLARLAPLAKTLLGLTWLAIKLLAVLLLSNGAAAQFVYQNF